MNDHLTITGRSVAASHASDTSHLCQASVPQQTIGSASVAPAGYRHAQATGLAVAEAGHRHTLALAVETVSPVDSAAIWTMAGCNWNRTPKFGPFGHFQRWRFAT